MSSFLDEFQANLEALPNILQKKYSLLRDLDKSLQEIEDFKRVVKAGNITPNTSHIRFLDGALDEQKHSIRIADETIALAVQAYDLVDAHIQQLDQFLKLCDEDNRCERDSAATAPAFPASSLDGSTKSGRGSESGRGGRKKTCLATAEGATEAEVAVAATFANPTGMVLDLPVYPNEPTYCFCSQVSYGDMIACDNPDCKIE